ncbi:hypothetical protein EDB86DRAFT_2833750 [Lactarius hatsudake]|nr:hypothetical protein EDB86DRAFT_2833750 [Lactarius hatsudake]
MWIHVFADDFMALATLLRLFCGQVLVWAEGAHCTWSYLAAPTNLVVSLLLSSSPAPTCTTHSFGSHPLPHPPLLVWYHGYHAPTGCTSSLNLRSSHARAQSSLLPGLSSCPESPSQGTTVAPLSNPRVIINLIMIAKHAKHDNDVIFESNIIGILSEKYLIYGENIDN